MNQTLLVADGDTESCKEYQRFLKTVGYRVETASNDRDCLEKLRSFRPAVLVLDLELPRGGGDGVFAWLQEENLISEIPLVLTATGRTTVDVRDFFERPIVNFLPKPFTLAALLEKVRAVCWAG
jgi:DNA-binding response OmpR family regulator